MRVVIKAGTSKPHAFHLADCYVLSRTYGTDTVELGTAEQQGNWACGICFRSDIKDLKCGHCHRPMRLRTANNKYIMITCSKCHTSVMIDKEKSHAH